MLYNLSPSQASPPVAPGLPPGCVSKPVSNSPRTSSASLLLMGGGQVLTIGRIDEMNEPHHTLYSVEFRGDGASLVSRLAEQKVSVLEQMNGRLNIELPAEGTQATVYEAALKAGATICGLHPKRSSLEETFLAALKRQGGA